jgi:hypothetical protein
MNLLISANAREGTMEKAIALQDTERFVAVENIKRFRLRLENEPEPREKEKLRQLLIAEEAKLDAFRRA